MATEIDVNSLQNIHFIGIGGVSMCGLARLAVEAGKRVTGSDARESGRTRYLQGLGIPVAIGHAVERVAEADAVVYTDAVRPNDPELTEARRLGVPVLRRGEYLGALSEQFPHTVAIAGTHGKTTATAMTVSVFLAAGLDPAVHIGADIPEAPEGVRTGGGAYFISEACEYKRNFLSLSRETAVVLNVEADHLDYFRDMDDIIDAYASFLAGSACPVVNADDVVLRHLAGKLSGAITFGLKMTADYRAEAVELMPSGAYAFELAERGEPLGRVELSVPGAHNVYNALAAAACARLAGAPFEAVRAGLHAYCGAERRMQYVGEYNGARAYLDYAHHPSEIRATLSAFLAAPHGRLVTVFEPHTYTRLKALFFEFARCFNGADEVVLTDVYAAREEPLPGVTSDALAEVIRETRVPCVNRGSYESAARYLKGVLRAGDLLLILGAGDVDRVWTLLQKA